MASNESMAIRVNEALDRLEQAVTSMKGEAVEPLPRLHRDREMLRVIQLEALANWLEELASTSLSPTKAKIVRKRKAPQKKAG